jgi:pullulanase
MTAANKMTVSQGYTANSIWGSNGGSVDTPLQTINYGSCHDNYTLFDNLTIDVMDATGCTAEEAAQQAAAMNSLAAAYYITAQGVPFIHAGEEMLRSKPDGKGGFVENSFKSSDKVNSIKWDLLDKAEYQSCYRYYQGLIAFRKAHPALRMTSAEDVAENITYETTGSVLSFLINGGANGEENDGLFVIFNPKKEAVELALPEGSWTVYINGEDAGVTPLETLAILRSPEALSAKIGSATR